MTALDLRAHPTQLLLWGRAAVVGTVALLTGVVSHVAGGGFLPGPVAMTLLLFASVAASAAFLVRPASGLRLVLLLAAGQTVVHGILSATSGHRGDPSPEVSTYVPVTGADAARDVFARYEQLSGGATHASADVTLTEWWNHQVDHLTEAGGLMVLSHLLGAAVLGLFLSVGESAMWRLVALVLARRSVRLGVRAREDAVAGARYGVRLQSLLLTPLDPQVRGAQLLARPVARHRGPPFVLAA